MTLKIMEEVTDWNAPGQQPNHVYLMAGDKAYAYSRWGHETPEYFSTPLRLDRRGRKFVQVKTNKLKFNLKIQTEKEEVSTPAGQLWEVAGSKGNRYTVSLNNSNWSCTCPGFGFRGHCRHIEETKSTQAV